MKNQLVKKILMVLIINLVAVDLGLAGDSFTIPVSCSIPAVPGLNVPLSEGETVKVDTAQTVQPDTITLNETKERTFAMIQEEKENIQTIYSR